MYHKGATALNNKKKCVMAEANKRINIQKEEECHRANWGQTIDILYDS